MAAQTGPAARLLWVLVPSGTDNSRVKLLSTVSFWLALAAASTGLIHAQAVSNSGTVRGSVMDPSNALVKGAVVEIQNPVSGFRQNAVTDASGNFEITNIPYNNYHLSANAPGFQTFSQDIDVRSPVPLQLKIALKIGTETTAVNVEAGADLVETEPTTHTDVDRGLFEKLPLESQSSSLSSLVTLASPGVAADSNGLFHGMGDHASNSFSIDGQPITDQQSKVFSNQLPVNSVQSMEVIEGAPPAEYGDKTSLVIVVDTRSGLGVTRPRGDVSTSYGTFGTSSGSFDLSYGGKQWGNFISLDAMNTGRFLDPPEFAVMHAKGNEENLFDRVDYKPSSRDTISINLQLTRSWFQTPNSFDMQSADAWSGLVVDNGGLGPDGQVVGPADQRSKIRTWNIAPTWTRVINPHTVFTFGGFARQDQYNYYPSNNPYSDLVPDLQSDSVGQNRTLTNLGLRSDINFVAGRHNLKAGVLHEHTILTENDRFGLVDPTFNAVCLNADGSPYTGPDITDPAACGGNLTANPNFTPILGCLDLTRTAPLPASDGCPQTQSAYYLYRGHADIRETALYVQDTIRLKNLTLNLGIRGDIYNGITSATQAEPRVGLAWNIKRTNTVIRASYARTLETPFNENLVLSSNGCSDAA
ncbi:MAG TPA: TonB-dependent receptor, partial [Bryobacteraceae bacterium]|nr:TonB-dependent receptor [Bryobacteraceae bacterium]